MKIWKLYLSIVNIVILLYYRLLYHRNMSNMIKCNNMIKRNKKYWSLKYHTYYIYRTSTYILPLFWTLRKTLNEKQFSVDEQVSLYVDNIFASESANFYAQMIDKFPYKWGKLSTISNRKYMRFTQIIHRLFRCIEYLENIFLFEIMKSQYNLTI